MDAFKLYEAKEDLLLPRVLSRFDDILGLTYSDYSGERLAISEFNVDHSMRKISPLYGLRHCVPWQARDRPWTDSFYFLHIFNHSLYNRPDSLRKPMFIDINGKETGYTPTSPGEIVARP